MPPPKEGFAAVASWLATDPDNETFVFRKFDQLAARRLLYTQAKLAHLEKQLDRMDRQVSESQDMSVKDAARTWEVMDEQRRKGVESATRHMDLIEEVAETLTKYRETPHIPI